MPTRPDKRQLPRVRAKEIGRDFKKLRSEYHLSLNQIGALSPGTVQKVESGDLNSTFYVLDNYVRVFGVDEVIKAMGWRL